MHLGCTTTGCTDDGRCEFYTEEAGQLQGDANSGASAGADETDDELDYDVEALTLKVAGVAVTLRVTTLANDSLPLEMLLDLEAKRTEISGQRLWEGSLLLCAELLSGKEASFAAGRVLELGAGTGIAGMLTCHLGAASVALTDGDPRCVKLMTKNVAESGLADRATAHQLIWGHDASIAAFSSAAAAAADATGSPRPAKGSQFDVVLAGDVLYKAELLEPFFRTVLVFLRPGGTLMLCHIPRAGVEHEAVRLALYAAGFDVSERIPEPAATTEIASRLCQDDAKRAKVYFCKRKLEL